MSKTIDQLNALKGVDATVTCIACGKKGKPHTLVQVGARRGYACSSECADRAVGKA